MKRNERAALAKTGAFACAAPGELVNVSEYVAAAVLEEVHDGALRVALRLPGVRAPNAGPAGSETCAQLHRASERPRACAVVFWSQAACVYAP